MKNIIKIRLINVFKKINFYFLNKKHFFTYILFFIDYKKQIAKVKGKLANNSKIWTGKNEEVLYVSLDFFQLQI